VPEAELDVLACLRRSGEATAAEVGRALASRRPMAHGSIVTLLTRLEARGLVTRRKGPVGKAFLFRSTPRAEGAVRHLVRSLVGRVFGGDRVFFVASLLEAAPPSRRELDRLRRLLADLTDRRRARSPRGAAR
jgi:predicted transcriptional regulator